METSHLSFYMLLCVGIGWSSSEILQRQKRNWIIDSFKIHENYTGPFPYVLGTVNIERRLTVFNIKGQGVEEEPKGTLTINRRTGTIKVHKPVDYETFQVLELTFQALNEEDNVIDTQLGIEINVVDANDNAPKFIQEMYDVSIPESTEQGHEVTTVKAVDVDTGNDGEVRYRMVSVMPKHDNVEFYLKEMPASKTAVIYFNGCLEHRTAQKYTIIVEAKDRGTYVQLSSTTTVTVRIMDGNNHPPIITGFTGPARITEGKEDVVVVNVQVTDEDDEGTPAWRAVYKIHGDTGSNFKITTDPKTNEGLLTVIKHLDYEESPKKVLNITVENEIPFHTCKVKTRTKSGPWVVVISGKDSSQLPLSVTVVVDDINDAPVFLKNNKQVTVRENSAVGRHLETFTAEDHDGESQNKIQYKIENDPADWVTVDSKTGKVTTTKLLDRESSFVKNNTYIVKILAFDNGKPPMTGTATLTIHILDENDNTPTLAVNTLDICQSDEQSKAGIEAFDLDEGINSGPFSFKLLGDVEGKWSVKPLQGHSTSLVKESKVSSGHHELQLEVSDLQSHSAVHNLLVTVCDCINPEEPNCRIRKSTGAAAGAPAIGIIFFALLLIAGVLLLSFLVSCKKKHAMIKEDEGSGQQLMNSNIETRGTDCKVALKHPVNGHNGQKTIKKSQVQTSAAAPKRTASLTRAQQANGQTYGQQQHQQHPAYYLQESMGASSSMKIQQLNRISSTRSSGRHQKYSAELSNSTVIYRLLPKVLNKKLYVMQASGEELCDYAPHVYAEEENSELSDALDAISILDIPFDPDSVLDLDSRFNHLASISMPSKTPEHTSL